MDLRAFVELLALVSEHSPLLIERGEPLPHEPLARFWNAGRAAARLRVRRLRGLLARSAVATAAENEALFDRAAPLMIDVFAADLTCRLSGAVLCAADFVSGIPFGRHVAQNLSTHQRAASHLALSILSDKADWPVHKLAAVDRIRRRLERWNDVLVGRLVAQYDLTEFACDALRAVEFGNEQRRLGGRPGDCRAWDLYLVSLRCSMPRLRLPGGKLGQLRDEQSRAMLGCLTELPVDAAKCL